MPFAVEINYSKIERRIDASAGIRVQVPWPRFAESCRVASHRADPFLFTGFNLV